MFFALTAEPGGRAPGRAAAGAGAQRRGAHVSATPEPPSRAPGRRAAGTRAVRSVFRTERRKLSSQLAIRLVALVCVLGPFMFGAVLRIQTGSPTDTLYGVWVHSSGFASSLVLLAFAGAWGFPLIAGIVAGDLFSSEDRYGTWKLVLTRSCTRRDVFAGKLLAADRADRRAA